MEFLFSDLNALLTQFKAEETNLTHKRRWLIGLDTGCNSKEFLKDRTLHESFLREDDVFYDTVKTLVERGFGAGSCVTRSPVFQESMELPDIANNPSFFLSLLDDMSNQGLYLLAKMMTGGLMKIEKVRWKLKKIIRESLSKMLKTRNGKHLENISKQISELCMDPNNFHKSGITVPPPVPTPASQSYSAAASEVLDALEYVPLQTLEAMYRKLRGVQGYMPQLRPKVTGWGRPRLLPLVRRTCKNMLSKIGEGDELQEPLAKAMTVAGLSFKLLRRHPTKEFQRFSPEIEALQNKIIKAIWLYENVGVNDVRHLQRLLDPSCGSLGGPHARAKVQKLLTQYLFECSDMDTIPECLFETLAIIKERSQTVPHNVLPKNDVEEEVECVLGVSAQIKQVVWDLLSENDFDKDYVDAYMENSEETDDSDDSDDDSNEQEEKLQENDRCLYLSHQIEGTGETNPADSTTTVSTTNMNSSPPMVTAHNCLISYGCDNVTNMNSSPKIDPEKTLLSSTLIGMERNLIHDKHNTSGNNYLSLQESCDETSTVAYRLIGCLLDEIAKIEGYKLHPKDIRYLRSNNSTLKVTRGVKKEEIYEDVKKEEIYEEEEDVRGSITLQVLEELLPSFPISGKERVKELMGLK